MLDLSPDKLLMLAVVALVVLGPNRLPGAARTLGRFVGQMRAMSASLQTEVRDALHDPEDAFTSALSELRPTEVRRTVRRAVTDTLAPFNPASATAHPVTPEATNLPSLPESTGVPGRPVPDDPAFN